MSSEGVKKRERDRWPFVVLNAGSNGAETGPKASCVSSMSSGRGSKAPRPLSSRGEVRSTSCS